MEAAMSKERPETSKLSDAQLVILSAGAQRSDNSLLPFPKSLNVKGAALGKVIETLHQRKLVQERKVSNNEAEWRRDEQHGSLGLFITEAGLFALGLDDAEEKRPAQAAAAATSQRKTGAAKPRAKVRKSPTKPKRSGDTGQSKQDLVLQMLRRRPGVTIDEVIAKTGWQAHSVRGFFSGSIRKKLSLPLTSEVGKDGTRRYHVAARPSAKA
jgi:hypothetical protein